jgi:putative adhesin
MSARSSFLLAALCVASAAAAQERTECDDRWWGFRGPSAHVCEVRTITVPAGGALSVDAGPNGSIDVTGENRRDVQVRATVHAWAYDEAEAERLASAVNVRSDGVLRADGPDQRGRTGWSVNYEVVAPRDIDLTLETQNGSVAVAAVRGNLRLQAENGSIRLDGVAGDVRGRTTNGGVDAELTGRTWEGAGLDLTTTNGGVRLRIPDGYSARLETGTVNGGIDIDFPVTVTGRIGREFSTTLGGGGPLVKAKTTNGQVRISRDRGDLTRLP